MFLTRVKIATDQLAQNFVDEIPWAMLSFGTAVATCVVVFLILVISEYCLSSKRSRVYSDPRRRYVHAYVRLGIVVFSLMVLTGGFWIAAQMFGLQFFSILLTYGLMSLIATYTFSIPLQNTGAFIFNTITAKICVDDVVAIEGTRVMGRVVYIGILYSTLESKTDRIDVPSLVFLTSIVRRIQEDSFTQTQRRS